MKNSCLLFSIVLLVSCTAKQEQQPEKKPVETTTYYLIRHAEKDTLNPQDHDPALTEAGMQRAGKWAEVFSSVPLDAIYTTQYKRTEQTAKPVANRQKLELQYYHPTAVYETDFLEQTKGKNILIVGHSNTIPAFANYILDKEKYSEFSESIYGNLFVIIKNENSAKDMLLHIE